MANISETEFKEIIKDIAVVQFSATWCGPCKNLSRTINENADKLKRTIYKIDIDDSSDLASALNIRSVPTIIRFENNKEVKRLIGNLSIEKLVELTI